MTRADEPRARGPVEDRLFERKAIIGMIHMPALPGAPRNDKTMSELIEFASSEVGKLERAGLDGVIVENAGDAPLSVVGTPVKSQIPIARSLPFLLAATFGDGPQTGVKVERPQRKRGRTTLSPGRTIAYFAAKEEASIDRHHLAPRAAGRRGRARGRPALSRCSEQFPAT